jgi:hypothetical protein
MSKKICVRVMVLLVVRCDCIKNYCLQPAQSGGTDDPPVDEILDFANH